MMDLFMDLADIVTEYFQGISKIKAQKFKSKLIAIGASVSFIAVIATVISHF